MNTFGNSNAQNFQPKEDDLGYKYYPRQYENAPGHPRLDIVLRPTPTLRHYDPETLMIKVVSSKGGIEHHIIHHPWRSHQLEFRVVASRIFWQDRVHKVKEAFTFGADLEIKTSEAATSCILTSTAPIIPLSDELTTPTILALEVETLIAVRRAAWLYNTAGYVQRLGDADPLALYRASLKALMEKIKTFDQDGMTGPINQLLHFIRHEPNASQLESQPALIDIL
jgi:hypothetical protein